MPSTSSLSHLFPTLAPPLSSSHLVGLYFASAWCPDCTPITPLLKKVYNAQPSQHDATTTNTNNKKLLEIVYISSDSSPEQFQNTYQTSHAPWSYVPYDNINERSKIKQHFGVCAGKEAMNLGMYNNGKRKAGIPTLILIDCETEQVVNEDAVNDLYKHGGDPVQVLKLWQNLVSSCRN